MLQFPLLLAFVRGWVGLGGTLKPSSCLLPCSGGFPAPPIPWLLFPPPCSQPGSPRRGERREHNAFLPPFPSLGCDLYSPPEAGTGWEGLSHAGLCTAHLCCSPGHSKQGECQPLAPAAPCPHQMQPCRAGSGLSLEQPQLGCAPPPMALQALGRFGHWERKGSSSGGDGGMGTGCVELWDLWRGWVWCLG